MKLREHDFLGQVIRRVRLIAQDYADRLPNDQGRAF